MDKALDIAIAGAGVAGLATATLLARLGHKVHLFDQFVRPRPVGSGLVIQPVGQAVLDALGAGGDARGRGARIWHMQGSEVHNGIKVLDVAYGPEGGPHYGLALHRGALFEALLAVLPPCVTLRSAARVTGRDAGHLLFDDGSRDGPFDLMVDAAGAGSPLSPLRARPLGYGALWGWVDWPDGTGTGLAPDRLHQRYAGASRMAGILPIGQVPGQQGPKAAVFWSLRSDAYRTWQARGLAAWQEEALRFWPTFGAFASQIVQPDQLTMARYSHGTLGRPCGAGIVHLGDAAHRTSPQLGQGANMALLDALALSRALERARGDIPLAMQYYTHARRWHIRSYQILSRLFTPMYQSDSHLQPLLRDRLLGPLSRVRPMPAILTRLVRGNLVPPLASLA